jgi:hypothetical protein
MSAVIVGSPGSGKKVLRRSEFSTQRNGLEFINEIYTIRTADRAKLQPAFDTLHKNYSESSTTYARMAVENVAFREIDGDLSEMTVSYVGLTSASGLPPALIKLIPNMDKGVFGPPCVINVEFISISSVAQALSSVPGALQLQVGGQKTPIPTQINGTILPGNPREPFSTGNAPTKVSAAFPPGAYQVFDYKGYVLESIQAEERGIFTVVIHEYAEQLDVILVG